MIALALAPEVERGHRRDRRGDRRRAARAGSARCPPRLRDAHYPGAQSSATARGYRYPTTTRAASSTQQYAPDAVVGRDYYAAVRPRRRARAGASGWPGCAASCAGATAAAG